MRIFLSSFSLSVVTILILSSLSLTSAGFAEPPEGIAEPLVPSADDRIMQIFQCSLTNGDYAPSSIFAANLDAFFNATKTETPVSGGFYNLTVGQKPSVDQVNGIGLCRGDLSSSDCNTCLSDASQTLRQRCQNKTEAIIWDSECMFRYSNRTILSTEETFPNWFFVNITGGRPEPTSFNQLLESLLSSLKSKAAAGDSRSKYADGSVAVNNIQTVYALVQCTPDLSAFDCSDCIDILIRNISSCCTGRQGALFYTPSCTLRFETFQFYSTAANNSSNSDTGKHGSKKGHTPIVAFVIPPVICLGVVLFVCGWCLLRRKRRWEVETSSLSIHEAEGEINCTDFDANQTENGAPTVQTQLRE